MQKSYVAVTFALAFAGAVGVNYYDKYKIREVELDTLKASLTAKGVAPAKVECLDTLMRRVGVYDFATIIKDAERTNELLEKSAELCSIRMMPR